MDHRGIHPQIQANDHGVAITHRGTLPAVTEHPFSEDMLREIFLRLPPQPSSLLRASAVCKLWRSLVTDTKFLRLFRAHHRKPPVLGIFQSDIYGKVFKSILDPPDRIPAQRFDLGRYSSVRGYSLLDCRHGRLLYKIREDHELLLVDPMDGKHRRLVAPPEFVRGRVDGAVVCAAGDHGHVHGGCHLSSYKVILVSTRRHKTTIACVYSFQTRQWGNLISTQPPCQMYDQGLPRNEDNIISALSPCQMYDLGLPATLVGNVLYWLLETDRILEFDLDRQNIGVTVGPTVTNDFLHGDRQITKVEDGDVGFAILAHPRFQVWRRNANCDPVATWTWVPWKAIEMHNILGLSPRFRGEESWLLGYDEDNDVIFVYARCNVYAVQLKSMQSKKFYEVDCIRRVHPFTSFYTPGTALNDGSDEAEILDVFKFSVPKGSDGYKWIDDFVSSG